MLCVPMERCCEKGGVRGETRISRVPGFPQGEVQTDARIVVSVLMSPGAVGEAMKLQKDGGDEVSTRSGLQGATFTPADGGAEVG